jgi:hypothetical protein
MTHVKVNSRIMWVAWGFCPGILSGYSVAEGEGEKSYQDMFRRLLRYVVLRFRRFDNVWSDVRDIISALIIVTDLFSDSFIRVSFRDGEQD